MKQPKKRWAWTARQRGRSTLYGSWMYRWQPPRGLIHREWKTHRSRTRQALHQMLRGTDEAAVHFLYHHKYSGHWEWL